MSERHRGAFGDRRALAVVVAALLLTAVLPRVIGLGHPAQTVFDEQYYALDGYSYIGGTPDRADPAAPRVRMPSERSWVHPPLAKELFALGEGPAGFQPLGYRLPAAMLGILSVLVLFAIAVELGWSRRWALLAATALGLDGIAIVHARLAMLDTVAVSFALVATFLALRWRRTGRPFELAACGFFVGASVASKWSLVPLLAILPFITAPAARTRHARWLWLAAFTLIPLAVYLAAYGPLWATHGLDVRGFFDLQLQMLRHNSADHRPNPANSAPWTWPVLAHATRYWVDDPAHARREILAVGNPVLWWSALVLVPVGMVRAAAGRRPASGLWLGIGGYALIFLPWLLAGRTTYLYYMTPAVPFLALAVVASLRTLPDRFRLPVTLGFTSALVLAGLAFLPLWTALPLPPWADRLRWLRSWT